MTRLTIPSLVPGDRIQHELLVYERAEKKTNGGDPFVILTLGNATGKIETAPIWSNQLEWAEGARIGKIVQAVGDVTLYGKNGVGKKQLALSGPVRVLPDARFALREFLPSIEAEPSALWSLVDRFRAGIESATLRRVLDLFFADDAFRERFETTPGSTSGHHAKLGGLLQHTWEVTNIARQTARTMGRKINQDLVLVGALLHDVGKVEAYEAGPGGFSFTPCGLLVGHVVLGTLMLERRLAEAGEAICTPGQLLELQHMILSHHGSLEFGSPVVPMTAEAEIVHRADEASAKATDFLETLEDPELFAGGREYSDRNVWRLGRRVWKRPHEWD